MAAKDGTDAVAPLNALGVGVVDAPLTAAEVVGQAEVAVAVQVVPVDLSELLDIRCEEPHSVAAGVAVPVDVEVEDVAELVGHGVGPAVTDLGGVRGQVTV